MSPRVGTQRILRPITIPVPGVRAREAGRVRRGISRARILWRYVGKSGTQGASMGLQVSTCGCGRWPLASAGPYSAQYLQSSGLSPPLHGHLHLLHLRGLHRSFLEYLQVSPGNLEGHPIRSTSTETHLSTPIPIILHISWKELQIVPW